MKTIFRERNYQYRAQSVSRLRVRDTEGAQRCVARSAANPAVARPERSEWNPLKIKKILFYNYEYNDKGLMTLRENSYAQYESFTYDNLDRLTGFTVGKRKAMGGGTRTFSYAPNGNITTSSEAGNYTYTGTSPHAVTGIDGTGNSQISPADCEVFYNAYNKPIKISEELNELELFYGANGTRNKTVFSDGTGFQKTTYFINDFYEKEVTNTVTRHLNYIYAGGQIVAINIKTATTDSMYYVHTDHLGSYNFITNQSQTVRQYFHFDPWGNRKVFEKWWADEPLGTDYITTRGFTGHEHLDEFRIINMKGRLYDPVIAQFFSPDPYIQRPDFTQSFNRYSYCFNNPLMYVDPTGYMVTNGGGDIKKGGDLDAVIVSAIRNTNMLRWELYLMGIDLWGFDGIVLPVLTFSAQGVGNDGGNGGGGGGGGGGIGWFIAENLRKAIEPVIDGAKSQQGKELLLAGEAKSTLIGQAAKSSKGVSQAASDLSAAKTFGRVATGAKITGAVGGAVSTYVAYTEYKSNPTVGSGVKTIINGAATVTGFIGPWGWAVSLGLSTADYYIDYYGGYDWIDSLFK